MADVRVFGRQEIPLAIPGKLIIGAADGKAVVAHADNLVLVIGDAGTYLGVGIFAPFCREQGDGHEILIPAQVIGSFA